MRRRRRGKSRVVTNFILVSLGFGFIYWFVECVIDVFLFYEGNQALNVLTKGGFSERLLTRLSTPDTNEFWMRLLVMLGFVVFGAFVQQVTSLRRGAEEELRELNEGLERRVKERTAQLEAANKELEAFSYSVSHDLRTPLRAIDGFSRALLEGQSDRLDDDGKHRLTAIRSSTERMGRLIDDLLAFSRSARKELQKSEVDIGELAQGVFDELRLVHPGRDVGLEVTDAPPAFGDVAMLREVLANLLSNAIKFTRTREAARIEFGGRAHEGNSHSVYYVRDNGVGLDMAYADKLFGVFQRLHRQEEFEGTGVGLAIVQRIVQRHGGRVWAEGEVNEGATFYFSLPTVEGQ